MYGKLKCDNKFSSESNVFRYSASQTFFTHKHFNTVRKLMEQQCPILLLSKTTYNLFDHCMAVYNTSSNININQAPVHVIPVLDPSLPAKWQWAVV